MRVRVIATVLSLVGACVLVGLSSGTAAGAATATIGTTKLGVSAYAGGDPNADYKESIDHNGNSNLSASDSDSGPDGSASGSATLASTASITKITASGTAFTSHTPDATVGLYPASVALITTLGESGQWVYAGGFDATASSTSPDGCITGIVSVRIYPPGETTPSVNAGTTVSSCTSGAAHTTFGNLNGIGVALEAGTTIKTSGSFDGPDSFASGTSNASFSVEVHQKLPPVSNTGLPTLAGSGVVGSTLTTSNGTWNGSPDTFTYQWRSGGGDVAGATTPSYTVSPADVGKLIQCYVTATNGSSTSSQYSNGVMGRAEAAPAAPVALANTALPAVSGKYVVGKKLTAGPGSWSHPPSTVTYQWLRNGKPIGGATSAGYKPVGKDKAKKLSVQVTVGAPNYLNGTATSTAKKVKPRPKG
jgi:hypothetical protein